MRAAPCETPHPHTFGDWGWEGKDQGFEELQGAEMSKRPSKQRSVRQLLRAGISLEKRSRLENIPRFVPWESTGVVRQVSGSGGGRALGCRQRTRHKREAYECRWHVQTPTLKKPGSKEEKKVDFGGTPG